MKLSELKKSGGKLRDWMGTAPKRNKPKPPGFVVQLPKWLGKNDVVVDLRPGDASKVLNAAVIWYLARNRPDTAQRGEKELAGVMAGIAARGR